MFNGDFYDFCWSYCSNLDWLGLKKKFLVSGLAKKNKCVSDNFWKKIRVGR